jgi:LacI family transcriptional regulator
MSVNAKRTATNGSALGSDAPVATLEMVAAEAGVSPSTVSRILNGTARVREAKRLAVEAAIAKLQFLPNPVARSLARGRSMAVGVVTQALDSPYYGAALVAIEQALLRANYSPLFVSGHWREHDERRCIEHLLSRRVEGIILLTSCLPDSELLRLSRHTPLVITGRKLEGSRICSLDSDCTAGAKLATEYLLDQGHQHIAFIGGPSDHPDAAQRFNGYKAALSARKIPVNKKLVVEGDYLEAGGYAAMNQLLDSGIEFTALFAANDQMAHGANVALYRRGIRVPDKISMVGFDDLPSSAYTVPPLTSVHRSIEEVGVSSAEAMIELIEKRVPTLRRLSATLAIRESTRSLRS